MLEAIDSLVNQITMYRLMVYYLLGLLAAGFIFSTTGTLHYNPIYIVISAAILVGACWTINKSLAYIFDAPINAESSIITALILALIITPDPTGFNILFLLAASGLAMASKYILTIGNKHIFNPAAIAVTLTALGPHQTASWWIGTTVLLPFVLIGGILIVRKINRGKMVVSFLLATSIATIVYSILGGANAITGIQDMIFSSATFFLGFVMLTEPLTSPTSLRGQRWYAVLVGVILPPPVHFFNFYTTPEISLIIGNIFAYIISPKTKLFPVLKQKLKITPDSAEFIFKPDRQFKYQPGQYMEWTLDHSNTDSRGNRRYFTLSSSPTEPEISIAVKFYENGSSFKDALLDIDEQTKIVASQISGDFILPTNQSQKITFIAGGIGITPFRSMIKYCLDNNEPRLITLLYSAKTESDLAYKKLLQEARSQIGLKTIYCLTDEKANIPGPNYHQGLITASLIKKEIPDYRDQLFYISGTHAMVTAMQNLMIDLGLPKNQIKTDFFPGYA